MNSHSMNDSVILVTGAGKGIGKAFVESLIQLDSDQLKGVKLCLTSRTGSDLKAVSALAETKKIEVETCSADLADSPLLALNRCVSRFGRVDTLIHSAGVGRFGDFLDLSEEDLRFTLRTNVEATFLLLQKTYGQMKSQPLKNGIRGQIQVVTSIAAEKAFPQSAIYCLSKYAQRGLLEVMRGYGYQDLIRILEVLPGATLTPMWGEVPASQSERMMSPEDIARPMIDALLMSSNASIESIRIRPIGGDI